MLTTHDSRLREEVNESFLFLVSYALCRVSIFLSLAKK